MQALAKVKRIQCAKFDWCNAIDATNNQKQSKVQDGRPWKIILGAIRNALKQSFLNCA